ncbi:NfeD family protein [Telmatobacter bradus]|uniref:NfeD family protein n=1 Tax=Telmatobacter bradus TaxID=474953 RepID=UPI003B43782B
MKLRMRRFFSLVITLLALLPWGLVATGLLFRASAVAQQADPRPLVVKLTLDDTIQPITEDELQRSIDRANREGAALLLVELNTPGGLLDSTRTMGGAILSSRVPVAVFVAPAGSRAGSAGFFLLEAADVAAMAPGTNAGAAHPVSEMGAMDETMAHKVTNDAEAFLRSYVTHRNRNADVAQSAVHDSLSFTAEEALQQRLVDLVARDDADLLAQLNGRTITRLDGSTQVLHTANFRMEAVEPTVRDRLLGWLMNPNIALLLLVGGGLLIYLEFNAPGTIVPGALGTLMVLTAIFALNLLPVRFTAVLLLLAAAILLVLEAKFGGHGVLALVGLLALVFGTLTLVAAPVPELAVSPWVALAVGAGFGGITIFLLRIAVRARHRKTLLGIDAMVGSMAVAMEPLAPEGHVQVEGEIWRGISAQPIAQGAPLRVVAHRQNLLVVKAAPTDQTGDSHA